MWFYKKGAVPLFEWIRCKPKVLLCSLLATMLFSTACAVMPTGRPEVNAGIIQTDTHEQVAVDLMSIFKQITIPFSTTIQVSSLNTNEMVNAIVKELVKAGYGIQRVSTDQGANLLKVSYEQTADNESRYRYTMSVGNIFISRIYDVISVGIVPASAFEVSGSLVVADVDDSRLNSDYPAEFKKITYTTFESANQEATAISLFSDSAPTNTGTSIVSSLGKNSSQLEIVNLFNGDSVFQSITDSHDRMARQVLIFANDSLLLGDNNKLLVREFLKQIETSSDQIRLIGCSNGQTDLEIGNEGLALGRAARVTDELLRMGIPRDRVLDEGCWAPVSAGDRFPGRGVVMELWRRKG